MEAGIKIEVTEPKDEQNDTKLEPSDSRRDPMELPDTSKVLERLRQILSTVNLDETTEKMLRIMLEKEFGTDLTHLKSDIRKEVEAYLEEQAVDGGQEEKEEAAGEATGGKKKRKAGGGFTKLIRLSPALSTFLGVEAESRPQVVKRIWDYIKANNLQKPQDKRKIILDDKLRTIFSGAITMFSMNAQLSKHFLDDDESGAPTKSKSKKKSKRNEDEEDEEDNDDDDDEDGEYKAPKSKKSSKASSSGNGGGGGFTRPYKLSSDLMGLTGVSEMSRPQLTKFFTNYFKENNLLDPSNRSMVLCNEKLKSLFQVETFKAFGQLQKLVTPHLSKD
ncbi:hypothetical protein CEUSTIGMA_g8000.t1 [Chlamydomonas eustigma]|uniref:DM2 domain-containing protein n=1 Tax=Chlamydomonas eustigma TaxID=1157962 RepID=A0A250XBV6_9CHLO|nr:hypothetical protein CEUSTIGMA_g8000.t1 [Chlamydomonas eustigma]|eukprot:GAX80563.1 hypothetical protein CEUSTIGMA_g8000.t1 [Chlamydomonas eustigma]